MTLREYNIEDFLEHPTFRLWVLDQDEAAATFWETWVDDNPAHKANVDKAREILLVLATPGRKPLPNDETLVWERIMKSVEAGKLLGNSARVVQMHSSIARKNTRRALGYAAAVAGLLVAVLAAVFFYPKGKEQYATAMGELKTIVLPDNSVVRLNVNSSIIYNKNWDDKGDREVWVSGEAFFTVMHKSNNQHFVVHTNDVDIQVVGTEFNVNTRRVKTQVVLNNGIVKLKLNGSSSTAAHQHKAITMKPGDMIVYSAATAELATKRVNPEEYSSWRTNVLTFHDIPVPEVIKSLHDNMGVTINLQDTALNGQTFTGSIPMDNIEVFFKTLSRSFEIKINRTETGVYEISKQ